MKVLVYLLHLSTITRAFLSGNQTIEPTQSFELRPVLEDVDELSRQHKDLFIDCSSYSSALLASSTAKRINVTSTIAPHGALNPAAPSTTVPFEQYWCKEFNAIELYGINASDKEYCLSLERSNYGTWAAANHTSITYNGGGGEILKRPDWWEPKLTQPCCGTLCQIVADAVEIYSWPIPVAYPNISTTMAPDKLNHTLFSVYVVYKNLRANGQCGTLGSSYSSITLSYHNTDHLTNLKSLEEGSTFRLQLPTELLSVNPAWSTCLDTMEQSVSPVEAPPWHLEPANALRPPQTMNTNPTEPSSTAAPVARASQPSPPMTALPSPPNANSGPSDEGIAGSLLPAKNSGREGNEPLTGNVVPVKDRPPSVKSAPSKDNAAAINDAPAGYDQSAGNNPQPGKNLGNLGSSEDFPLADQQPGQSSAGSPLFGDAPASFKAAFTTQVGGHVVQAATSTDGVIVDEQYMISRGGSIVLSGTPIALNTNGNLVLGTSTISNFLASLTSDSNAVFTVSREIGGHIIQVATSNDGILLDGQYITPGGPSIVLSGTSIAFHTNGNLVLGTSTVQNLYSSLASESNAVFTVGDEAITLFSNRLVAGAITLRPEDPSVTIDGTLLSLGLFGLRIGTKTIPLDFKTSPVPTAAITVAGRPIQPLPNRMAIAGATLTANAAAITLAGTPVSFGDNRLIVGTSTISLRSPNPTSILTVGGQKYTFSEIASGVSIAGTTLQIGQAAVTISGTLVALDSSGLVINGTSTIPYQSVDGATALPNAIGGLILAGFNVGPTTSSTTAASAVSMSSQRSMTGSRDGLQAFIGRASRREIPLNGLTVIALVLLLTILRCVVF